MQLNCIKLNPNHSCKEKNSTMYQFRTALLALALILIFNSFALAEKLPVFVSILPQKYFVEQIAKDKTDISVLVQPGASPHTYEPKPSQMVALSTAQIYFSIGVPFENSWLKKIQAANPKINIVHTDTGIQKIPMAVHHHHEINHGEEEHTGLDPHIWLSPLLVKIQAETIFHALVAADPSNQGFYEANYKAFVNRLNRLDNQLHATFDDQKHYKFMVFHPSWGYFAQAYGLEQIAIEVEGKNPKPAQLRDLIKDARKNDISVIFVQPEFSTKSARLIAKEIQGQVIFADPLAANWMANMTDIAEKFKKALK